MLETGEKDLKHFFPDCLMSTLVLKMFVFVIFVFKVENVCSKGFPVAT